MTGIILHVPFFYEHFSIFLKLLGPYNHFKFRKKLLKQKHQGMRVSMQLHVL